jgi:uncharacterized protein GlcG (DUF336 family)
MSMCHSRNFYKFFILLGLWINFCFVLSCSKGGNSGRSGGVGDSDCDGSCVNLNLSVDDVRQILSQGLAGAKANSVNATFSITDRVGNVLAVYSMVGAAPTTTINGGIGAVGGLEGVTVPSTLAAISKAGTGAYLSSQGNAFSTRTASQIIQENFNPGEKNQPAGPLFGVQFSQLLCGDVVSINPALASGLSLSGKFVAGGSIGPRPLPLGLSADPGGLPLYKNGDLVGGIGVELDGVYRVDRNIFDTDNDIEERLALLSSIGFEASSQRVAPNINLGKSLRYTDLGYEDLKADEKGVAELDESRVMSVPLFSDGKIKAGAVFGDISSGIAETVRAGQAAAVLVNGSGAPRFPTRSGSSVNGKQLTAREVDALLDSALVTATRSRGVIRRPLDTPARVSIWVVDHTGRQLGFIRGQDAPVFGIDVALQKARAAAFFSSSDASAKISSFGFSGYVSSVKIFAGRDLFNGAYAFANRSIGNLARPFFTDGINGNINGPLSLPYPGSGSIGGRSWSPFDTGLQLDLVFQGLLQSLGASRALPSSCVGQSGVRLANGIQIFPGAVPLYRGETLIGAIGVSGDGIDQDDLTAFYGASRQGLDYIGHTDIGDSKLGFNAPLNKRADLINFLVYEGVRLRYVNCPEAPFIGDNEQNVCEGL